ncbi:hypothetical protein [Tuwongella immobilis]|uniref:hypothetical protein n=1 Tax=Tuwongella immobilis TaxID=692036 RepID=UPI001E5E634D|nr:hypothetical protein [Tuwongella immobilis]
MRWDYPDGGGSVEAELLRSVDWFNAHAVPPVGQTMRLDLPEMGAEGEAIVTAIEACPEIAPGCGRLVMSRFRHSHGEVYDLRLVGSDGIIGVTAHHPLWSATRGAWVSAAELEPGERLSGITQTADRGIGEGAGVVVEVASVLPRGQEPVYNIEVDGDHCYRVGTSGLLVHNASDRDVTCDFKDCNEVMTLTGVPQCPYNPTRSNDPTGACKECNDEDDCPSCQAKDRQDAERDYFRYPADHWNCYPYGKRSSWRSGKTASVVCGQCCQERVVKVDGKNMTHVWIVQRCVCQRK